MIDFWPLKNTKPIYQLLWLLLFFVGSSIIVPSFLMLVGIPIWGKSVILSGISQETPLSYLIYFQFFTQVGVFAGVALFFARLNGSNVLGYLKLKKSYPPSFILLAIIAMVSVIPLSSWLLELSLSFPYPESMRGFVETLKQQEDIGNALMQRFLNVEGLGWLAFNLVFLAVVPAICEELLFRGALMAVLQKLFRNKHIVVMITAIVFSAIHMQFFSFFSRFALGLVLGYATIYSGSLFPAIAAHFVNNAFSVVGYYFSDQKEIDKIGTTDNYWVLFLATFVALAAIVAMRRKSLDYENQS
jgi:membrane protease YdiL (CAAX protease family)